MRITERNLFLWFIALPRIKTTLEMVLGRAEAENTTNLSTRNKFDSFIV
jgi:hypothetical protein